MPDFSRYRLLKQALVLGNSLAFVIIVMKLLLSFLVYVASDDQNQTY